MIGLGNRMRGDDAAGLEVARALQGTPGLESLECEREPSVLIDAWAGAGLAVVVDALAPAGEPGRVGRWELTDEPLPTELRTSASTHALDLATTVELARALGRLPERLVLYGVEAAGFERGDGLDDAVAAGVRRAAELVREEAGAA